MSNARLNALVALGAIAVSFFGKAYAGETDLLLRMAMKAPSKSGIVKSIPSDGFSKMVPCFVKTTDVSSLEDAIIYKGGVFISSAGKIVSAQIPLGAIDYIASRDEVEFIEMASPLSGKMNTARAAGEVVVVQDGSALGTAYDGTNVVVGVVDDALDYGHPDFEGQGGIPRVQYLRQTIGSDTYECTKRNFNDNNCQIDDEGQGYLHGTHVTGIAAGGDEVYTGVAPMADIMFVFLSVSDAYTSGSAASSFSTAVLEGVSTIFDKADAIDKAAVVNLSVGTSLGAHDGTSLLEQGLDALVDGKRGRVIVGAAGNEQVDEEEWAASIVDYVGGIHAPIEVADGTGEAARLSIWNGNGAVGAFTGGTVVDLWLSPGQKDICTVEIYGYTGGRQGVDFTFPGVSNTGEATLATGQVAFSADATQEASSDDSKVKLTFNIDDSDARNDKPHALILIEPDTAGGGNAGNLEDYWYDVVVRASGGACSGHMWVYFDYTLYHDYLKNIEGMGFDIVDGARGTGYLLADGDSTHTTTIPATANGVIAAGSWLAEKPIDSGLSEWTAVNGITYEQNDIDAPGGSGSLIGDLSSYSSLGPTADGRNKPDIIAPGEPIISAKARGTTVSTSLEIDEYYYKSAGTSMASPYVTGVVALLLQRNNTLTVDEVKTALASGAKVDGLIAKTVVAADSYGPGKVDAAAVLGSVVGDISAYSGTGDLEGSGGGCGLAGSHADRCYPYASILLILIGVLSVLVRRKITV